MKMNYIKKLNAFREWLLINELPAGAIALWHTLMSINNAARWKHSFNAPNAIVGQLSGLSRQGILDARNKLIENDLIKCENGQKGKAPIYEIISLVDFAEQPTSALLDTSLDTSTGESLTILKHKEKQERRKEEAREVELVKIYEANVSWLSPLARDEFARWVGLVVEAVMLEAIKLTTKHDGHTFSYMEKILQEWKRVNVVTLDAVMAYERRKSSAKNNTIPFRKQQGASKLSVFDELREEVSL